MSSESYRILNFFDWSGGVRDRRSNPLAFPQNALMGGENVELVDCGLKTRRGTSVTSTGNLPAGEVMALAQVRFPSNETSFLVAQAANGVDVVTNTNGQGLPSPSTENAPRVVMAVAYDIQNNYIWVYAGQEANLALPLGDLWYLDVDNLEWHEVTDATGGLSWVMGADMIYDPVNHRLILFGGNTSQYPVPNRWWQFDIETRVWSQLSVSGTATWSAWDSEWYGQVWMHRMIYRSTTHSIIIMGGLYNSGTSMPSPTTYVEMDIATLTQVTKVAPSGPAINPSVWYLFGAAYDEGTDAITIMDHYSGEVWTLDCVNETYTQLAGLPALGGTEGFASNLCLVSCGGRLYAWGMGAAGESAAAMWGLGESGWVRATLSEGTRPLLQSYPIVIGDTAYLVCGYTYDEEGNLIGVTGASFFEGVCTFVPSASGIGSSGATGSKLYASNDTLPTTEATFTEIYDLGDADRVTFAVLNDRVVITEGKAQPPLVWGGCMATDGSDWMYPKAVLVSQDGENFYDISDRVLDKDVDNGADIGSIGADGFLAVCTDMPLVEGFYFEMETPNTVETEAAGNQQTADLALSSDDTVVVEDLKGLIANWVQDSGTTGHFTDSSNNPVTLGTGNDCPYVEAGLNVIFSATEATIVSITDDGEGTGEVELSATLSSQSVTSVVGLGADTGALTMNSGFSPVLTSFTKTVPGTTAACGISGMSVRQVISAADLTQSGGYFRITISGAAGTTPTYGFGKMVLYGTHHPIAQLAKQKAMVSRIAIGERDGSTANTTETPTPITFPMRPSYKHSSDYPVWDYPSFTVTDDDGTLYMTIDSSEIGRTFVSDWIKFPIDSSKSYLVIMDAMDLRVASSRGCALAKITSGGGYYYVAGTGNVQETWNIADVSTLGFTQVADLTCGISKIEVKSRYPLPSQLLVAYTSAEATFDISVIEVLRSVSVEQTALGSSHAYHAVSLDGKSTFQVFKDSAWRTIVQYSTVWQYLDASDTWQNASEDSLIMALKEAFAITANQMSAAEMEAITSDEWMGTGGFVVHQTLTLDFAVGLLADSENAPVVNSYTITYNDAGETTIQGYTGNHWTAKEGFTDNTRLNDVPWGQNGTVVYDGTDPFEAQYYVLNEVPGFWFRFKSNGTAEGTSVTRVLYKAPCQPLSNISDGQSDIPLAMIFHDTSKDSKKDITIEVSGGQGAYVTDDAGEVTYKSGKATLPVETEDYLYVGYTLKFNQIEVTPYDDYENAVNSTLSAEYWNGKEWTGLDIVDGTVGDDEDNLKTFSTKGKITWFLPSDWKMRIPLGTDFPRGYYIRLAVSANLTTTTAIDEVRVYAVPDDLVKHKFAVSFRDRIALVSRPDAPDQVDISRALEEYGFIGDDSGSYRVGGMDSIQCAVSAWNGLFLGKTETWHQLLGQTPEDFSFESVEAARHIPLNTRVIVKAPIGGIDSGTKYGLFYINRFGAFVSTGLHTDSEWNTGQGALLSDAVNWWDEGSLPRLALDSLHNACGEYWPVKNWIVWSVPMITEEGQTSQSTNNRLIIFDVALGAWLPPFTISLASLTAAYHHNPNAPGKLGEIGLYGGDYQGRIIRLFSSEDTTDMGQPIAAWIETGWLHLGSPEWVKLIRRLQVYGQTSVGNNITIKMWVDGDADPGAPAYILSLDQLQELGSTVFSREEEAFNAQGRFFKFRIEFQDVAHIFGIQIGMSLIREWGSI